jgi:DNA invertase Pin-like site-specific DNA recombinase
MTVFEANSAIERAKKPKMERYAMYLRKSRVDLELEAISKEETLARHKKMLFALAERKGILPSQITIYHEMVSGDSIDERPEMLRLLEDVYKGIYAGVLVAEIERLARGNTKDQGEVADAFTFSDTKIFTPQKDYDPNDEFDQEYFEFGLFMSRREYKTIRRRLMTGKEQAVQEGNYILPEPPFGFDIVKVKRKNRYLVEKPEESK